MVAKTPPMGWNSWDCYGASVTEDIVRQNADYMAKHLKQYGWEYIVVDIQWYEPLAKSHEYNPFADVCVDVYGRAIPAENRFPSSAGGKGFAPLAEYVHSLGLKFGIHIMRGIPRKSTALDLPIKGTNTTAQQIASPSDVCEWNGDMFGVNPEKDGAQAYYNSIFELYAGWGVDFVKVDDICRELPRAQKELVMLSEALRGCGREMVLSLSPGPALPEKAELYKKTANMWRVTDDFWDKWELLYDMFARAQTWFVHAGAGHFPDFDMLPIGAILQDYGEDGWTKFTQDEQITMLTLWCVARSPLMIGGELTKLDEFTLSLLTNAELIEVLNNTHSAHPLFREKTESGEKIAWFTSHTDGRRYYAALFNAGETECEITAALPVDAPMSCYDIWAKKEAGRADGSVSASVKPHGAVLLRLTRI